jgi:hypothetical protein
MKKTENFIQSWTEEDSPEIRKAFVELCEYLKVLSDSTFEFVERPGVSYSLRPKHQKQKKRPLYVMVDVIDDTPGERWLSVCFYGEMITDPNEMGDLIPQGLLNEDGYCFDVSEYDPDMIQYLKTRLEEAYNNSIE